jgi:MFS family permease
VSSTTARARSYRWAILSAGVFAQAANSAILLGLPAIAPDIRQAFGLTLPQVGVVLAAVNFGAVATLLAWGIVADRIGERAVIAVCQTGAGAALLWAAYSSTFAELVVALSVTGALGAGSTQPAAAR